MTSNAGNSLDTLVGQAIIVRTVTYHYTGRLVALDEHWLHLTDAAWVADSGRWHQALTIGTLDEVEPYPDGSTVYVARSAVVDLTVWAHDLPRTVR